MSIDVNKIIQIYDNCLTILEAKQNLYIDNSELNALFQKFNYRKIEQKNLCSEFIQNGILRVAKTWARKNSIYQSFVDLHRHSYAQLKYKVDTLRNNNQIISQQDQLIAQIQTMIRQWKQNIHPVQYYNTKQRKLLKKDIQDKLFTLKSITNKTRESTAPLYTRKIQSEFKDNIIAVYMDQSHKDRQLIGMTTKTHCQIAQQINRIDTSLPSFHVPYQLSPQMNPFFNQVYEILSRNSQPSDRRLRRYSEALTEAIHKHYYFWSGFRKHLQYNISLIQQLMAAIAQIKAHFQQKQQKIYKLLVDIPNPISKLFRIDIIYNFIKSFNTAYGASNIIQVLGQKLFKRKQFCLKMQNQCKQYMNRVMKQAIQRNHSYHHYAVVDKKFFEDQAKSERTVVKSLLQVFRNFLIESSKLTKQTTRRFQYQCKMNILQPHQVNPLLSKLILADNQQLSVLSVNGSTLEQINTTQNTQISKKKKNQIKIRKFQEFINNLFIFNTDQVGEQVKKFSCALGPKLLLHGKLYIHPEGLLFESHFNKKNLLFGKTKLFVPKKQIVQIDMKKTLLVFPDAVLIKTEHGLISFHALGQRKQISDAIKQAYLAQTNIVMDIGQQNENLPDFKPFDSTKRRNQAQFKSILQPYDTIIYDTSFKGSKLNKMFRRYFSDDSFQINGQTHENFKSYYLLQIQAKNPKSTPITPPPPCYFSYVNQATASDHYPQKSQRIHTYLKSLPKVPFVSKGGDGDCEQQQTYNWISPQLLVIDIVSVVKGFSLTQGMKIYIKTILKQVSDGVQMTITSKIVFSKQSSTNGLVKSPAISNLKQSMAKMGGIMQRCEKSRNNSQGQGQGGTVSDDTMGNQSMVGANNNSQYDGTSSGSGKIFTNNGGIVISRNNLPYIAAGILVFYILTILLIKKL